MNTAVSLVIFKGVSKKGNVYYQLVATIICANQLVKTSGLIFEDVALSLAEAGVKIIEKKVKEDNIPF